MSAPRLELPGRVLRPELMDEEDGSEADLGRCLRDLERVNVASLGYRPTLAWLGAVACGAPRLSILDVGCGGGDMLRRVRRWADKRSIDVELVGVDVNPAAVRVARARTPTAMNIRYEAANLFDLPPDRRFDVVLSALFAHHLPNEDLPRFLRWMEARASLGWVVNDLHRHAIPYWALRLGFSVLPVHRFVRHDGPVSVRRAFSRADMRAIAAAAGLDADAVAVSWHLPFRWRMSRIKGSR